MPETSRGLHPDIDPETGDLKPDVDLPPAERSFRRMWANESERAAFMYRLSRDQQQLPVEVQQVVAGQQFDGYGPTPDPYHGFMQYKTTIADLRRGSGEVTGADIAGMSLEEYDRLFDERGRPREGVTFSPTGRDVDVTDRGSGIDPYSQREFGGNR